MDDMHSRLRSARDGMRANGYAAGADYLADALSIIDGLQCEVKALQQDAVQHALNSRRLLERIAELEGQNVGRGRFQALRGALKRRQRGRGLTMETSADAAQLERRDDETDTAWIERLRAYFAAERREQTRRDAERWADSDRQP